VIERLVGRLPTEPSHRRVAALATALLFTLSTPVLAEDGATYGARPGPGDGDRSSGTIFLTVAAGASVSDAVEVINLTGQPTSFDVYLADVVATTGGGRAPAGREVAISGPAAWIDVPQPSVEVPGRSGNLVSFTVDPPPNTSPGAYTVAILVQPQETATGGAITATTRTGLWIEIQVLEGSDAAPAVPAGPAISWDVPWIPLTAVALIAFAAVILYLSRRRWHVWLEQWREERALIREFRSRRRHEAAAGTHGRRG
jgi:hypothetical protein